MPETHATAFHLELWTHADSRTRAVVDPSGQLAAENIAFRSRTVLKRDVLLAFEDDNDDGHVGSPRAAYVRQVRSTADCGVDKHVRKSNLWRPPNLRTTDLPLRPGGRAPAA